MTQPAEENTIHLPAARRYKPDNADFLFEMFRKKTELLQTSEWLKERRMTALTLLEERGLPTPKLERWKYTNLPRAIPEGLYPVLPAYDVAGGEKIIGRLQTLFEEDWVREVITSDIYDRYGDNSLYALNRMFVEEGVVLDIPADYSRDEPIEIVWNGKDGALYNPVLIVRVADGADVTIVERHEGSGAYWTNQVSHFLVGANTRLIYCHIVEDSPAAVNTNLTDIHLERDSSFQSFSLTSGGALTRNQVQAHLNGENISCDMNGISLLRGGQHGDTTLEYVHNAPHCHSNQFFRTLLDDHAHGVYQGKIHVVQEAQKTDAYQLSNALVLSEGAEMDAKPELEIYADDVSCSHGSTTGEIDEDSLFYLRSRGLSEKEARNLLIQAFLFEVVDTISDEAIRLQCEERVKEWLF